MLTTSNQLADTISLAKSVITAMVCAVLLATASCDKDSPTTPSPLPLNLTGTWRGTISVIGTPAEMTWTLTQTNDAITGPVRVTLQTGTVLLNGALSGSLAGTVLTYRITVPVGGIPLQPSCSGQIGGSANATNPSTLNGTYNVTLSTCPTGLTAGTFALVRQ
jgi:hypothetical protein